MYIHTYIHTQLVHDIPPHPHTCRQSSRMDRFVQVCLECRMTFWCCRLHVLGHACACVEWRQSPCVDVLERSFTCMFFHLYEYVCKARQCMGVCFRQYILSRALPCSPYSACQFMCPILCMPIPFHTQIHTCGYTYMQSCFSYIHATIHTCDYVFMQRRGTTSIP